MYSVVNIRLNLAEFEAKKKHRKLLRRAENKFNFTYGFAEPTPAKEKLYKAHKHRFRGFIHDTLEDYLKAGFEKTVFDTREVCIYDGDKLIAVSYFDLGNNSMASLLGLYDEDYSKWSLGTVTMLKEIEFGLATNRKWYYPGYTLDLPSSFEYKLRLGKMEYYTPEKYWDSFENFDPKCTTGYDLRHKTQELSKQLKARGISHRNWLYPYFSMAYVFPWNTEYLNTPMLIEIGHDIEGMIAAAYLPEEKAYSIFRVIPSTEIPPAIKMEMNSEFSESNKYLNYVYETSLSIVGFQDTEFLIKQIEKIINKPDFLRSI
jgi:arginine-tRNA-protein transferase